MKNLSFIWIAAIIMSVPKVSFSFCGFYVAKADAKLFNETSQVIVVRDDNKSTITMSNDYQGDVKEFAMVVPVPVVLKENDIKIADRYIFDMLDAYTGPRLVEYFDENPCYERHHYWKKSEAMPSSSVNMDMSMSEKESIKLGVTIEAKYTVGEYDILILSAEQSDGLKIWLKKNGYQIPDQAEEVLDPYIKNNMKFFVAKVNMKEKASAGLDYLRPIQISFESNKFMLPIRLGMANANGAQDMMVYAFTKSGRVEVNNYRTVEIPSNKEIPTFIKDDFGRFYYDLFEKAYERNHKKAVFLEYSWDLSSSNFVKCDPCAVDPPTYTQLKDAGVFWVEKAYSRGWGDADYKGEVFITRLHIKYDRKNFPQDLIFQTTPNQASYQGRYILNHPVEGNLNCKESVNYYKKVLNRREKELENLAMLTGRDINQYDYYIKTYEKKWKRAVEEHGINKGEIFDTDIFKKTYPYSLWLIIFIVGLSLLRKVEKLRS
jgi:hypothetical protein